MTNGRRRATEEGTRIPPQSLEAERAVLGAALLDRTVAPMLAEVAPEIFYKDSHRHVVQAIQTVLSRGETPDALTVAEELRRRDRFEEVGGHSMLAVLQEEGTVATQARVYLNLVREYAARREFIQRTREATESAYDLSRPLPDLIGDHVTGCVRLGTTFTPMPVLGPVEFAHELRLGADPPRLSTGLSIFDDLAGGGLVPSDLHVIAGRPGVGKTAIGVQIAHHTASVLGLPTLFCSLDMTRRQIGKRYLGFASLEGLGLEQSGFHITDPTAPTVAQLSALVRQRVVEHAIQVVVVDHLLNIAPTRELGRKNLEVAEVAKGLRQLAKALDIVVLALHQMSRAVEYRSDPRPILSDLAESGAIEQEAGMVCFAWNPEEKKIGRDALPLVLSLAKNRHGPTGDQAYRFIQSKGRIEPATR